MKIIELTESEYRKFESKHQFGNLMQEYERAKLREWMGWKVHLIGSKADNKVNSSCLMLERKGYAMIQMGPVLDWSDLGFVEKWFKALLEYCKEQGIISLEVFPYVVMSVRDKHGEVLEKFDVSKLKKLFEKLGFEYGGETIEVQPKAMRWMSIKDISGMKNMDEVWASYKHTMRTQIRRHSPEVRVDELKDASELKEVFSMIGESNLRNKVNDRSLDYYKKIYELFGEKVVFHIARKRDDGAPVAAHMFFITDHEAVSYAAGISEKYKSFNGMTLLNNAFFEYCLNHGITRCNMYGVSGDFSSENRLLSYKSQFGIKIEEYIGGFTYVLDKKAVAKNERKQKVLGALRKVKYGGKRIVNKIRK